MILLGLFIGIFEVRQLAEFSVRIIGTCAVLYGFFLCRMLGAGDVKLMALCVGILGVWDGLLMIFCGLILAFLWVLWKGRPWKYGYRCLFGVQVRLAPWLFLGYCLMNLLKMGE